MGVRRNVHGEQFQLLLPLYINEEHFERALPKTRGVLCRLAGVHASEFKPLVAVGVLCRMLNTLVVLIADKGMAACDRTLDGYCMIFHLLLGFAKRYPEILRHAHSSVDRFVRCPESRVKRRLRSLGHFLPLIAISPRITWDAVAGSYLRESFSRSVLWNGRADKALVKVTAPELKEEPDYERLRATMEAQKVSNRLTLFQHVPSPPLISSY